MHWGKCSMRWNFGLFSRLDWTSFRVGMNSLPTPSTICNFCLVMVWQSEHKVLQSSSRCLLKHFPISTSLQYNYTFHTWSLCCGCRHYGLTTRTGCEGLGKRKEPSSSKPKLSGRITLSQKKHNWRVCVEGSSLLISSENVSASSIWNFKLSNDLPFPLAVLSLLPQTLQKLLSSSASASLQTPMSSLKRAQISAITSCRNNSYPPQLANRENRSMKFSWCGS